MAVDREPRAIDTTYRGYKFRSRLEARVAIFFDSFREPWEYEVEGYELPSGKYLPDFWLSRLDCWLEIKGTRPLPRELQLCRELKEATGKPVAIMHGLPEIPELLDDKYIASRLTVFCDDLTDSSGGESEWEESFWAFDLNGDLCLCSNWYGNREFMTPGMLGTFEAMKCLDAIEGPLREEHLATARSARFEFGKRKT
jgi:hypothetical protein